MQVGTREGREGRVLRSPFVAGWHPLPASSSKQTTRPQPADVFFFFVRTCGCACDTLARWFPAPKAATVILFFHANAEAAQVFAMQLFVPHSMERRKKEEDSETRKTP